MNRVIDNTNTKTISRPDIDSNLELNRDNLALKNKNSADNSRRYMTSDDFVDYFQKNRSNSTTGSYRTDSLNQTRQETIVLRTQNTSNVRAQAVNRGMNEVTPNRRTTSNGINTQTSHTQVMQSNVYIPRSIKNNVQQRVKDVQNSYSVSSGTVRDTSSTIRVQSIQNMPKIKSKEQDSCERSDSKLKQFIKNISKRWNTPEYRGYQDTSKTRVLPLTMVMVIFTISVSLLLIVGSSVLLNTASNQVSQLEYEVAELREEGEELQSKLELKNELADIDKLAAEYGMINKNYATVKYIKVDNGDKITNYAEEDDESLNLASLLSAFGFKLK